jgi:hypothetical protein
LFLFWCCFSFFLILASNQSARILSTSMSAPSANYRRLALLRATSFIYLAAFSASFTFLSSYLPACHCLTRSTFSASAFAKRSALAWAACSSRSPNTIPAQAEGFDIMFRSSLVVAGGNLGTLVGGLTL